MNVFFLVGVLGWYISGWVHFIQQISSLRREKEKIEKVKRVIQSKSKNSEQRSVVDDERIGENETSRKLDSQPTRAE